MKEEDAVLEMIYRFIRAGLTHDVDTAMSMISENVLGIGMNEQGTISSKEELRQLLEAQSQVPVDSFTIGFPDSKVRYHPPGFATASVVYELRDHDGGKQSNQCAFIQTVAARKEEGQWKICLLQAVPVELTEKSIENYPLKFADSMLMELRGKLKEEAFQILNSSLSVGVLGAYMENDGDLPPFYINDSLLSMLGYTMEEFFALLKNDSFGVVHPDDTKRIQREIAKGLEKGLEYTCQYRLVDKNKNIRWVVEHGKQSCQDGRDVILSAFVDVTQLVELQQTLEKKNEMILSSINYASRIQRNLLPAEADFKKAFADYAILWSPKDIVGGDIYWLRRFEQGTVLCVADCTGHGIPGAMLTMLISTTLDNIVNESNCADTSQIMYALDQRESQILHSSAKRSGSIVDIRDGCDLAVLFVGKDGMLTYSSAGIQLFSCDGQAVHRYRGQRINIGERKLKGAQQVEKVRLPLARQTIYVASDGLFDQIGGEDSRPFGYRKFQELALKHHGEKLAVISEKVWEAFEEHRNDNQRRDDVELLAFRV